MTFASTFRELVVPDLDAECRRLAVPLAWDEIGYAEAEAAVMDIAYKRGAPFLPPHIYDDLVDWICTTLLKYSHAEMPAVIEERASEERVWAQTVEWEIALARFLRSLTPEEAIERYGF